MAVPAAHDLNQRTALAGRMTGRCSVTLGNRSLSFVFNIGNEADVGTETLYVQSLIFEFMAAVDVILTF